MIPATQWFPRGQKDYDHLQALKEWREILRAEITNWEQLPSVLRLAYPPVELSYIIGKQVEQLEKHMREIDTSITFLKSR